MTTYIATIRHHSISRAREITMTCGLSAAKRRATAEFGDEQNDYEIVIFDAARDEIVSRRRLTDRKWTDTI